MEATSNKKNKASRIEKGKGSRKESTQSHLPKPLQSGMVGGLPGKSSLHRHGWLCPTQCAPGKGGLQSNIVLEFQFSRKHGKETIKQSVISLKRAKAPERNRRKATCLNRSKAARSKGYQRNTASLLKAGFAWTNRSQRGEVADAITTHNELL